MTQETNRPKTIIDINKHGIRRERFAVDPKQYKRMKKRREYQEKNRDISDNK